MADRRGPRARKVVQKSADSTVTSTTGFTTSASSTHGSTAPGCIISMPVPSPANPAPSAKVNTSNVASPSKMKNELLKSFKNRTCLLQRDLVRLCHITDIHERLKVLSSVWRSAGLLLAESTHDACDNVMHLVIRQTLQLLLAGKWNTLLFADRQALRELIQQCMTVMDQNLVHVLHRCQFMMGQWDDPWGHPVLQRLMGVDRDDDDDDDSKDIKQEATCNALNSIESITLRSLAKHKRIRIAGGLDESHPHATQIKEEIAYLVQERGCMIALRLQKLCESKLFVQACSLAGLSIRAMRSVETTHSLRRTSSPTQTNYINDMYLSLLYLLGRSDEFMAEISAYTLSLAVAMCCRYPYVAISETMPVAYHDMSTKALQVFMAIFLSGRLISGEERMLCELCKEWLRINQHHDNLRARLQHLITLCTGFEHLYVILDALMQTFPDPSLHKVEKIEILCRGMTREMNDLEQMKANQSIDAQRILASEQQLSPRFHTLAEVFEDFPGLSRELTLTAFSLHPTEIGFAHIESFASGLASGSNGLNGQSAAVLQECPIHEEVSPNDTQSSFCVCIGCGVKVVVANGLQAPVNYTQRVDSLHSVTGNLFCNMSAYDVDAAPNLILDTFELLSFENRNDLLTLITAPRIKNLSWLMEWPELKQNCEELLRSTKIVRIEHTVAAANDHLVYLNPQFEKYRHMQPHEYPGIELGYERFYPDDEDDDIDGNDDDTSSASETEREMTELNAREKKAAQLAERRKRHYANKAKVDPTTNTYKVNAVVDPSQRRPRGRPIRYRDDGLATSAPRTKRPTVKVEPQTYPSYIKQEEVEIKSEAVSPVPEPTRSDGSDSERILIEAELRSADEHLHKINQHVDLYEAIIPRREDGFLNVKDEPMEQGVTVASMTDSTMVKDERIEQGVTVKDEPIEQAVTVTIDDKDEPIDVKDEPIEQAITVAIPSVPCCTMIKDEPPVVKLETEPQSGSATFEMVGTEFGENLVIGIHQEIPSTCMPSCENEFIAHSSQSLVEEPLLTDQPPANTTRTKRNKSVRLRKPKTKTAETHTNGVTSDLGFTPDTTKHFEPPSSISDLECRVSPPTNRVDEAIESPPSGVFQRTSPPKRRSKDSATTRHPKRIRKSGNDSKNTAATTKNLNCPLYVNTDTFTADRLNESVRNAKTTAPASEIVHSQSDTCESPEMPTPLGTTNTSLEHFSHHDLSSIHLGDPMKPVNDSTASIAHNQHDQHPFPEPLEVNDSNMIDYNDMEHQYNIESIMTPQVIDTTESNETKELCRTSDLEPTVVSDPITHGLISSPVVLNSAVGDSICDSTIDIDQQPNTAPEDVKCKPDSTGDLDASEQMENRANAESTTDKTSQFDSQQAFDSALFTSYVPLERLSDELIGWRTNNPEYPPNNRLFQQPRVMLQRIEYHEPRPTPTESIEVSSDDESSVQPDDVIQSISDDDDNRVETNVSYFHNDVVIMDDPEEDPLYLGQSEAETSSNAEEMPSDQPRVQFRYSATVTHGIDQLPELPCTSFRNKMHEEVPEVDRTVEPDSLNSCAGTDSDENVYDSDEKLSRMAMTSSSSEASAPGCTRLAMPEAIIDDESSNDSNTRLQATRRSPFIEDVRAYPWRRNHDDDQNGDGSPPSGGPGSSSNGNNSLRDGHASTSSSNGGSDRTHPQRGSPNSGAPGVKSHSSTIVAAPLPTLPSQPHRHSRVEFTKSPAPSGRSNVNNLTVWVQVQPSGPTDKRHITSRGVLSSRKPNQPADAAQGQNRRVVARNSAAGVRASDLMCTVATDVPRRARHIRRPQYLLDYCPNLAQSPTDAHAKISATADNHSKISSQQLEDAIRQAFLSRPPEARPERCLTRAAYAAHRRLVAELTDTEHFEPSADTSTTIVSVVQVTRTSATTIRPTTTSVNSSDAANSGFIVIPPAQHEPIDYHPPQHLLQILNAPPSRNLSQTSFTGTATHGNILAASSTSSPPSTVSDASLPTSTNHPSAGHCGIISNIQTIDSTSLQSNSMFICNADGKTIQLKALPKSTGRVNRQTNNAAPKARHPSSTLIAPANTGNVMIVSSSSTACIVSTSTSTSVLPTSGHSFVTNFTQSFDGNNELLLAPHDEMSLESAESMVNAAAAQPVIIIDSASSNCDLIDATSIVLKEPNESEPGASHVYYARKPVVAPDAPKTSHEPQTTVRNYPGTMAADIKSTLARSRVKVNHNRLGKCVTIVSPAGAGLVQTTDATSSPSPRSSSNSQPVGRSRPKLRQILVSNGSVTKSASTPVVTNSMVVRQSTRKAQTVATSQSCTTAVSTEPSTLDQLREFDAVLEQIKERSHTTVATTLVTTEAVSSVIRTTVAKATSLSKVVCKMLDGESVHMAYPQQHGGSQKATVKRIKESEQPPPPPNPTPPVKFVLGPQPKQSFSSRPVEDEKTVSRIYDILKEYGEQLRSSPENTKPAPRRRIPPGPNQPVATDSETATTTTSSVSSVTTCVTSGTKKRKVPAVPVNKSQRSTAVIDLVDSDENSSPIPSPPPQFTQSAPPNIAQTKVARPVASARRQIILSQAPDTSPTRNQPETTQPVASARRQIILSQAPDTSPTHNQPATTQQNYIPPISVNPGQSVDYQSLSNQIVLTNVLDQTSPQQQQPQSTIDVANPAASYISSIVDAKSGAAVFVQSAVQPNTMLHQDFDDTNQAQIIQMPGSAFARVPQPSYTDMPSYTILSDAHQLDNIQGHTIIQDLGGGQFAIVENEHVDDGMLSLCYGDQIVSVDNVNDSQPMMCYDDQLVSGEGVNESQTVMFSEDPLVSVEGLNESQNLMCYEDQLVSGEGVNESQTTMCYEDQLVSGEGGIESQSMMCYEDQLESVEGVNESQTMMCYDDQLLSVEGVNESQSMMSYEDPMVNVEGVNESQPMMSYEDPMVNVEGVNESQPMMCYENQLVTVEGVNESQPIILVDSAELGQYYIDQYMQDPTVSTPTDTIIQQEEQYQEKASSIKLYLKDYIDHYMQDPIVSTDTIIQQDDHQYQGNASPRKLYLKDYDDPEPNALPLVTPVSSSLDTDLAHQSSKFPMMNNETGNDLSSQFLLDDIQPSSSHQNNLIIESNASRCNAIGSNGQMLMLSDSEMMDIQERRRAALEREMLMQKSLAEECEDLGVDEPNYSDLFPEADLPFDTDTPPFDLDTMFGDDDGGDYLFTETTLPPVIW